MLRVGGLALLLLLTGCASTEPKVKWTRIGGHWWTTDTQTSDISRDLGPAVEALRHLK